YTDFAMRFPNLSKSDAAWVPERLDEVAAQFPTATPKQVFNRVALELDARHGDATALAAINGTGPGTRPAPAVAEGVPTGGTLPRAGQSLQWHQLDAEERGAWDELVRLNMVEDTPEAKAEWLADYSEEKARNAANA
ncbi:MAG: hypothetical protein VXW22_10540, partial [Pseudomonadota bacterium]|nr:hypothetical protein [Pseudomonadota bacterium]